MGESRPCGFGHQYKISAWLLPPTNPRELCCPVEGTTEIEAVFRMCFQDMHSFLLSSGQATTFTTQQCFSEAWRSSPTLPHSSPVKSLLDVQIFVVLETRESLLPGLCLQDVSFHYIILTSPHANLSQAGASGASHTLLKHLSF